MIREATHDDLPAIFEMGRQFHAASPYAGLAFCQDSLEFFARYLIDGGGVILLLCDPEPRGAIGIVLSPAVFNKTIMRAEEMFWWCSGGGGLGLLKEAEAWARRKGVFSLTMSCLENDRRAQMSRLYEGLGYAAGEHHFVKVLQSW